MKTKKTPALYNLQLNEDELYSLGGWLKENAGSLLSTAAGTAMSFIPGLQSVGIPMAVSGASGLLGGAMAGEQEVTDYSDETVYPRTVGNKNMTPNVMHFKGGGQAKVGKVMREYKKGKLHSGSKKGPIVKDRKQAIAIALSEAGLDKYPNGGLMEIDGPSHEEGGVKLMPGVEVEGGETVRGNVVNSDTWKINKSTVKKYNLKPVAIGKTPAEYSKIISKQYDKKKNMIGAENDLNIELGKIDLMSVDMAEPAEDMKMQGGGEYIYPTPRKQWRPEDYLYDPRFTDATGSYKPEQTGYTGFPMPQDMFSKMQTYKGMTLPEVVVRPNKVGNINNSKVTSSSISSTQVTVPKVPSESDYARSNDTFFGDNQPIKINSSEPSLLNRTRINAGTEPLAKTSYDPKLKYNPATDKSLSSMGNVDWGNVGQTALGIAPMAVNAFLAGRTAAEGPDKVKLPRIQYDPMHPELIDPSYQIQEARDAYATGNEQMSQVSKKDWLRRRIQSATEEGKTTSGIRGAASATNAQVINNARQINKEGQLRTNLANLETTMREEEINAANKGAWQTSKDYYLSNAGTMAGEYGRDLRLEDANDQYNDRLLDVLRLTGEGLGVDINSAGKMSRTVSPTVSGEFKLPANITTPLLNQLDPYGNPVSPEESINRFGWGSMPALRRNPYTGKYVMNKFMR